MPKETFRIQAIPYHLIMKQFKYTQGVQTHIVYFETCHSLIATLFLRFEDLFDLPFLRIRIFLYTPQLSMDFFSLTHRYLFPGTILRVLRL